MHSVYLPVAHVSVNLLWMLFFGFIVGGMAGFFGVGGGFLITPMLNAIFGVPYPIAVGSSLSLLVGITVASTIRHSKYGNIDYKLGFIMVVGTALGVNAGAKLLTGIKYVQGLLLTNMGYHIDLIEIVMSLSYLVMLSLIGLSIFRESLKALKMTRGVVMGTPVSGEPEASAGVKRIRALRIKPIISFPASGISGISVWVITGIAFAVGVLSGFMGIGGGFIMMPALIYVIGCPTVIAVGTSLFGIFFTAAYGAFTYSLDGNIDLVLVIPVLISSAIGSVIGASFTRKAGGPSVRMLFSLIAFVAVIIVAVKLCATLLYG
ncbi:MAG: sulfite exporter TauE/SafE family protein [Deltaproteobacteria bacterium]|nr:sulfite exporter TauE/SafE family protein [Deltaproteobacteria bacterium]MCL5277960.1 sulfite exporter TauE/SafE family protein [Deltaproteobacteria bacterium]